MESSTFGHVTDWNEVIKKEAKGRNDADLGEVLEVKDDIVVTERGTLNKEKFYLPKSIPHGFNGHTLLFDITEEEAKERFTNESVLKQATESQSTATSTAASDIERPIPVIEEKLEVSKNKTMQEAKIIKEKQVSETKRISEQLISEKVSVRNAAEEEGTEEKEGEKEEKE